MKLRIHYTDSKATVRKKLLYLIPITIVMVPVLAVQQFFVTIWIGYKESAIDIYRIYKTGKV
jgi:hypothetical protein